MAKPCICPPRHLACCASCGKTRGRALTRAQILKQVWGYEVYPTTRTVDNHIAELRNRLEADPARPRHILTVHGVGYRFVE